MKNKLVLKNFLSRSLEQKFVWSFKIQTLTRQSKHWKMGGEKSVCCFGPKLLGRAEEPDERISNLGLSHPDLNFFAFLSGNLDCCKPALHWCWAVLPWFGTPWCGHCSTLRCVWGFTRSSSQGEATPRGQSNTWRNRLDLFWRFGPKAKQSWQTQKLSRRLVFFFDF